MGKKGHNELTLVHNTSLFLLRLMAERGGRAGCEHIRIRISHFALTSHGEKFAQWSHILTNWAHRVSLLIAG